MLNVLLGPFIRKDTLDFKEERIMKAENESGIWNIVNEVSNPSRQSDWKLTTETGITEDEQEIADIFNKFFVSKISDLKEGIDKKLVEDPLRSPSTAWPHGFGANHSLLFFVQLWHHHIETIKIQ